MRGLTPTIPALGGSHPQSPSWEVEAEGSEVQSQPKPHSEFKTFLGSVGEEGGRRGREQDGGGVL